jgi:hypothetical protein
VLENAIDAPLAHTRGQVVPGAARFLAYQLPSEIEDKPPADYSRHAPTDLILGSIYNGVRRPTRISDGHSETSLLNMRPRSISLI